MPTLDICSKIYEVYKRPFCLSCHVLLFYQSTVSDPSTTRH